jgi:hypothetical protein
MPRLSELCGDLCETAAFAALGVGSMQALGLAHSLGVEFGKRRASLSLARALPDARSSATELRHQPRLLIRGKRAGDLAYHRAARA